jgi:glycosyltransferase involved in cell wall biosynthesis
MLQISWKVFIWVNLDGKNMNILFLSELLYPHGSGASFATYLYAKLLSEAGFKLTIVTSRFQNEPGVSRQRNTTIYRLPLLNENSSMKYSTLRRPDVLLSSLTRRLLKWADVVYIPRFWYSAIPLAKAYKKPVIVHSHDFISICPLSVLYNSSERDVCQKGASCSARCIYAHETHSRGSNKSWHMRLASTVLNLGIWPAMGRLASLSDAIICVSKAQRSILIEHAHWARKKAEVIYNPIPELSPIALTGEDLGYFGGPSYLKGFEVLLKALSYRISLKYSQVSVHATKFPSEYDRLASLFDGLGLTTYGKLGAVGYHRVYQRIRAVIVPSIWFETWGYVITEAILRGRIIVASNIGGIPEQVRDCRGAFLVEPGNHYQLAEKINFVNSLSRDDAIDLASSNSEAFGKRFSNAATLRCFSRLCDKLVGESR